jgi:hypothetical protein
MPFDYTSGNPDNLVGGGPARMQDIQGPFYDLRAYLNSAVGGGGSTVPVLSGVPVLDVGLLNQRRAGRQLANADFTSLGLSVPIALWNLSDLTDVSGNTRVLANKGGVSFGTGINGLAATSAVFNGPAGSALYIADTGAADPFRIRTGSWGCWFRTAKRATYQGLVGKLGPNTSTGNSWYSLITNANVVMVSGSLDGGSVNTGTATGVSDVCDDRWHFVVGTHDGTAIRLYVDGILEASGSLSGPLNGSAEPLNIGAQDADGTAAAVNAHYGRVDEAFVTADVLSEDQVRCLYAAKLTHTLSAQPSGVTLNVNRRRRGATLVVGDFPTQPLRLHNFTGGSLSDEGSQAQPLANNGTTVAVAGADGALGNAYSFAAGQSLSASDAGLPAGTASRSYGCWFKCGVPGAIATVIGWGTMTTADVRLQLNTNPGILYAMNGSDFVQGVFVGDGVWHSAIVVEDNAAVDGVRRKFYIDGRLVGGSTVLNAITLAGVNRFRIGADPTGAQLFTGQVDGAFVCGYALTFEQVAALYAKGSQALGASPKNAGDHIERMDATSLYLIADTLESQHTIDVGVTA